MPADTLSIHGVGTQWAHLNIQAQRHDWGYNTKQSIATSLSFRISPLSVVFPKKAHAQSRSMAGESSEEETYDDLEGKQVMYSPYAHPCFTTDVMVLEIEAKSRPALHYRANLHRSQGRHFHQGIYCDPHRNCLQGV